tara:strand:- start:1111 stop:1347 length:237 start_codon:yes stop_codon:yes gene_type:complete
MQDVLDNREIENILDILEAIEDEELAASLLAEFNEATKNHGKLVMNRDPKLSNEDWKKMCDDAANEVEMILKKIEEHR